MVLSEYDNRNSKGLYRRRLKNGLGARPFPVDRLAYEKSTSL